MEQDSRVFDSEEFLNQFYKDKNGHPEEKVYSKKEEWGCEAFDMIPECESALDIGSGPVLNLAAFASRKCKNIYLSDYNIKCFQHISRELTKETSKEKSFWAERIKVIAQIEGTEPKQVEERMKESVKACFKCDLTKNDILQIPYLKKVDVIMSSLTLESVAKDSQDYQRMIKNMKKYLKQGGYIYFFGALGESFYRVKDQKLPAFPLSEDFIRQFLGRNNFQILRFNVFIYKTPVTQVSDSKGYFCVLAKSYD